MFSISKNLLSNGQNNKTKTVSLTKSHDLIKFTKSNSTVTNCEVSKLVTPKIIHATETTKSSIIVNAACDIPLGINSCDIGLKEVIEETDLNCQNLKKNNQMTRLSVTHSSGRLKIYSEDSQDKMKISRILDHIKLADDCHSCNVLLQFGGDSTTVKLSTTQTIAKGQKLLMWFAPEILTVMAVPFLTPINIQGEKNYKCHRCQKIFEYPNPLKIHLSLECNDITSIKNIWQKLYENIIKYETNKYCNDSKATSINSTINLNSSNNFNFSLETSTQKNNEQSEKKHPSKPSRLSIPSPELTTVSNPSPHSDEISHEDVTKLSNRPSSVPVQYHSAFKPYNTYNRAYLPLQSDLFNPYLPNALSLFSHNINSLITPQNKYLLDPQMNLSHDNMDHRNIFVQQAVDMETLVSNLGKSKQGHLCIYCGKIYSRKYGLKIHIRTHTGFKPLKCKYCLRPFGDPSNLNKHVRLHAEGETPYKCDLCGKILVRRRDLERHVKSRHQSDYNIGTNDVEESKQAKEKLPTLCV